MLRSHKAEMLVLLLFEFTLRMLSTLSSYHSPCQDTRGPLWRTKEGSIRHVICILCPNYVFWSTFVKYTSFYLIILLIKIQGVLLLKMDLWRIEEASICHLVCISCLPEVFWRTFVKQTSLYHVILLVKIQGVLLLKMDLWRTKEGSPRHLICILYPKKIFGLTFVK